MVKKKVHKKVPKKGKKVKFSSAAYQLEDEIRDLINLISVWKGEEVQDVTTRIEPKTAKVLVSKLSKLARDVGEYCTSCK